MSGGLGGGILAIISSKTGSVIRRRLSLCNMINVFHYGGGGGGGRERCGGNSAGKWFPAEIY